MRVKGEREGGMEGEKREKREKREARSEKREERSEKREERRERPTGADVRLVGRDHRLDDDAVSGVAACLDGAELDGSEARDEHEWLAVERVVAEGDVDDWAAEGGRAGGRVRTSRRTQAGIRANVV